MTASKPQFSRLALICMAILVTLSPSLAYPLQDGEVAIVPLDLGYNRPGLGGPENPYRLIELIRNPAQIRPAIHVAIGNPAGDGKLVVLPSGKKKEFSSTERWKHTQTLMQAAGWEVPAELQARDVRVKSIKVTGTASTYGRNDGFAGQRTSSGRVVTPSTAALQMDLAHVLSDLGLVPFSMRDVKATLTMPDGRKVAKRLEDKGGLVNYLGEAYWRKAIKTMRVDQNGVGTLAPLPASTYRVVDIFTQRRSTLIPQVTVEIHLKKPLVRKAALTPSQCQAWMQKNFEDPAPQSRGFLPDFD
jgi:hypothetical protein